MGLEWNFNLLLRDWAGDEVYVEYQMFLGEAGESYVGFFWSELGSGYEQRASTMSFGNLPW